MSTTKNSLFIKASAERIYRALTTPEALEIWQAPDSMKGKIHNFDLRVGGGYEMSLYYTGPGNDSKGKTNSNEDRFIAKFKELSPDKIIEIINFNSDDPKFAGEMIMEISLDEQDGGTEVTFLFKNIPPGIKPEDNEAGTRSSLNKLAGYLT